MKKRMSFLLCSLILANGAFLDASNPKKPSASRCWNVLLKLGGAACLSASSVLIGQFFLKEWDEYAIHSEKALALRTEWLKTMEQKFPDPILRNAQGAPSHGFKVWAMQVMPNDHPYHAEAFRAWPHDLFGMELVLAAIALVAAGALVYDCFTGTISEQADEDIELGDVTETAAI